MSQDEIAVNDQVVAEPTAAESAPAETSPEVADEVLSALSSDEDESPKAETEQEVPAEAEEAPAETPDDTPAEEEPRGEDKQLTPKAENRFQQLANDNRALREQIEQLNAQVYQPQTVQDLIDEGLTPELAEVRALKQELEVTNYNNRVVEAQSSLNQESMQVLKDFPIFDPESDNFQEDVALQAAELLEANLITDPNTGQIIGSHVSPYKIYKPIADAYAKSALQGEIAGQKAAERQLSAVDSPSSVSPREAKKDPTLEILSSDD